MHSVRSFHLGRCHCDMNTKQLHLNAMEKIVRKMQHWLLQLRSVFLYHLERSTRERDWLF